MKFRYQLLLFCGLIGCTLGQQTTHCNGDRVSVQCEVTNRLQWGGSALSGQCPTDTNLILLNRDNLTTSNIGDTFTCGVFTATVTNISTQTVGTITAIIISSTLSVSATPSLDGTDIVCFGGVTPTVTEPLSVQEVPTPEESSSLTQLSKSSVRVNITVGDDRCADLYWVEVSQNGSSAQPMNTSSPSSTIEVGGLLLCGYTYSFVAYTQATSGIQSVRITLSPLAVNLSGLNGVSNINSTLFTIEWSQIDNGMESQCITGYRLSWNGGMYNTFETSVSSTDLTSAGFPYCQSVLVTVNPVTPVGLVTGASQTVIFQHPDFSEPQVSASFTIQTDGSLTMIIQWQEGLSSNGVPVRMYGYSVAGAECTPNNTVGSSESSVTYIVPGAEPNDTFNYCVLFQNNECVAVRNGSVSVPNLAFTDVQVVQSGATSYSISGTLVSLTSTSNGSDMHIIASIEPPDADAPEIVADYPTGSQQYTVEFTGLRPGIIYTFTVRVALRNDSSTVGLPVMDNFMIPTPFPVWAIIAIVIVVVLLLAVAVVSGVGLWWWWVKQCAMKDGGKPNHPKDVEVVELSSNSPSTVEHKSIPLTGGEYNTVGLVVTAGGEYDTVGLVGTAGGEYDTVGSVGTAGGVYDVDAQKKPQSNNKEQGEQTNDPKPKKISSPTDIVHETAPTGDIYAVVNKRASKKKTGDPPPPGSICQLTYAVIDVAKVNHKNPRAPTSHQTLPCTVGALEYATINTNN